MPAKVVNILVISILVVLSLAIFGNGMTKPVGRDEQMYCTGAVCLAEGKMIYRDFSYAAQLPYHPLLCAALYKIFNTNYYLLVGRILSVFCDILIIVCILGIYRHIFKPFQITGILLGLAGVVLYVFNLLVDYASGYAWNHDIVMSCVVLSFWLFISTDFKQKSRYWRIAVIGALLTFASCMRITTSLVCLLFLMMLLIQPAESLKQRFRTTLPFLASMALVLVWPVWIIAHGPRAFFLNLVKIPMLYGQWLSEIGLVYNKIGLTFSCLKTPGYFILIILVIYLYVMILYLRRRFRILDIGNLLFPLLLVLAFFIIAFIPPTTWRQYLAMPVPFLIISLALPLRYLRHLPERTGINRHFKVASVFVALCALIAVNFNSVVFSRIPVVLVPEYWVPVEIHKISQDIAQRTKEPKLILTLTPLFAIEGDCDIYTELSCGAIIYRIGDYMSASEREVTHTIGPNTLGRLLDKSPPSAVILGSEMEILERPIYELVLGDDWQKEEYANGLVAYFRP